jgi:hypothetical protein
MAAADRSFNLRKLLKNQGQRTRRTGAWSLCWSCMMVSAAPKLSVKLSPAAGLSAVQSAAMVKFADGPVGWSSETVVTVQAFPPGIAKL